MDWIIGVCNTGADGVAIFRFRGSENEMKEKLMSLINDDRAKDDESWTHGCEEVNDIQTVDFGSGRELYGYGSYEDYHIDYTAKEFARVDFI